MAKLVVTIDPRVGISAMMKRLRAKALVSGVSRFGDNKLLVEVRTPDVAYAIVDMQIVEGVKHVNEYEDEEYPPVAD